ncbi:MAG TPA: hypothetical protein VIM96_04175 [Pseudomonadales bacterium]|jgi:hypothetical protein
MTAATRDEKVLLKFRSTDTVTGVTRSTAKKIAKELGFNETQTIHFALAKLAKEVLPAYEQDDGPLTKKEMAAIEKLAPQERPFTATKSLF